MPNPYTEAAERVRLSEEASRQRLRDEFEALKARLLQTGAQGQLTPEAQATTLGIPQTTFASQLGSAEARGAGITDLLATRGAGYETEQTAQSEAIERIKEAAAKAFEVSEKSAALGALQQSMGGGRGGGGGRRGGGGGGRRGGGGDKDSAFNLGAEWRAQAGIQWAMSQADPEAALNMLAQANPDMAPTLYGMAGMFMGEQDLLAQEEAADREQRQRFAFSKWHEATQGGATADRATWANLSYMYPDLADVPRSAFPKKGTRVIGPQGQPITIKPVKGKSKPGGGKPKKGKKAPKSAWAEFGGMFGA
jgi:hypothetical protein